MGLRDSIRAVLAPFSPIEELPLNERAIDSFTNYPDLETQLLAVQGLTARPWRAPSITDAVGVPAIYRAVTLIANTTGSLSLNAYRKGRRLSNEDRPRLIVRPNPFTTPRDFFRDTAYAMATRGEAWWWVAARGPDGEALSLLPVNPAEVTVEENERDLRYPIVKWRGRTMPNADMVQITLLREPGALRGAGPLQVCGAAISVAVEAQQWAANFFAAGGYPSILIKAAMMLEPAEAEALKAQWLETYSNTPKVIDPGIEGVDELGKNVEGAQMMEAREYQVGDAARMFGIPASMLDHAVPGSSLTYQNLETEFAKFVRACLWPNYLEPIEQAMSDLLTRSTTARFNIDALQRADSATRFNNYQVGISAGFMTADEARVSEGWEPGDVENAPAPFAPPAAIPGPIAKRSAAEPIRCDGMTQKLRNGVTRMERCNKLLAEAPPFFGTCPRCKKESRVEAPSQPVPQAIPAPRVQVRTIHARGSAPAAAPPPPEPEPIVVNVPAPVVNYAPPEVHVPAPVVNVDTAPLADEMRKFEERLTERIAEATKPRAVVRRVNRDAKGLITEIVEEEN